MRARTRVQWTLSAETVTGAHAAWAAVVSEDSSGAVSHDVYLSTQGPNHAYGTEFSEAVNSAGDYSSTIAWMGQRAAQRTQQMKWYHISSVITGTIVMNVIQEQNSTLGAFSTTSLMLLMRL